MRAIFVCGNKQCARVWAFDYPERRTVHEGYGRKRTEAFRTTEAGRTRTMGYDTVCADCGTHSRRFGVVRGSTTSTPCDHRCTDAKGFRCECSCGGRNHGQSHLACEAVGSLI